MHVYDLPTVRTTFLATVATKASPCSFGGETRVLMADGTTKPISEIEPGDMVLAQDPETGEIGAREVTDAWVHDDDLVRLEIDGEIVRTTEDHPFWNDTDREWQRADQLDHGDLVLTADGRRVKVGQVLGSAGRGSAYNLSVEGLHTYHVLFGDEAVLVHNSHTCTWQLRNPDGTIRSSGTIESGARSAPGRRLTWNEQLTTHTEYKLMEDLAGVAKPGDIISLQGTLAPCKAGGGCQSAMAKFAAENGVKIIYRQQGVSTPWVFGG
jgi:hypothetical protein